MMSIARAQTCPRCGAYGLRCAGCGTYYRYDTGGRCLARSCQAAAAPNVCRCGRVHVTASA
jgi:hypothetical protein